MREEHELVLYPSKETVRSEELDSLVMVLKAGHDKHEATLCLWVQRRDPATVWKDLALSVDVVGE